MDAHIECRDAEQQLRHLHAEIDTLGAEDVADKGEGVGDHQHSHPREQAAHVVACAHPLVAEEEHEYRFGKKEGERTHNQCGTAEEKGEAAHIVPQGLAFSHFGG